MLCFGFFFFKQKTAYEMRISDWSSDVCSSDLPAAAPQVTGEREHEVRASVADSTVRVDVRLLDNLMTLVGELVLARNQVVQLVSDQDDAVLSATSQRLSLITTELQETAMKTRMQPISNIWSKLTRVGRDLAAACNRSEEQTSELQPLMRS